MPREVFGADHAFLDRKEVLSLEEIARVAGLFVEQGVRKIRLTGGEPLVRRGLETLVEKLTAIRGLEDLSLTTNGSLLTPARARALRDAGLGRVTVSLDALDDAVFKRINDVNFPVSGVLRAIDAAAEVGLAPIKVNMVVKRGGNEDQIVPMARRFRGTGHIVRFIEYMDVGNSNGWELSDVVTAREIVERIDEQYPLEPVGANYSGEVAKRWRYRDGAGEIGVIASVSQPFCGGCTRARLSAEGRLYTCLFATSGHDLRAPLRSGAPDDELRTLVAPHLGPARRSLLGASNRGHHRRGRGSAGCGRGGEGRAGQARDAEDRDVLYRRLRCPSGPTPPPPPLPVHPRPGSGREPGPGPVFRTIARTNRRAVNAPDARTVANLPLRTPSWRRRDEFAGVSEPAT